MVNGEQSRSQSMIGLPFTVYCSPDALRLALCVMSLVLWIRILFLICNLQSTIIKPGIMLENVYGRLGISLGKDGRRLTPLFINCS
jgi:hypothetical protein